MMKKLRIVAIIVMTVFCVYACSPGEDTDTKPDYGISLSVSVSHSFPSALLDYGARSPFTVTVTNIGKQPTGHLTVILSGAQSGSYTVSPEIIASIEVGGNRTFTIVPKTGLAEGTYSAIVTVSGSNSISANFVVYFTVGLSAGDEITSTNGIKLVWIPAGTYTRGSNDSEDLNASPPHQVTLTSGFYMGKYEVTQSQWETVMGTTVSQQDINDWGLYGVGNNYPMYYVNWYDAIAFCNRLSIMEGLTPAYSILDSTNPDNWGSVPTSSNSTWNAVTIVSGSTGYRLPTEAQWEYAARAGTTSPWSHNEAEHNDYMWYSANSGSQTQPVGTRYPNDWGLHDMHGNVLEWCWDWFESYSSGAQTDPMGASSGSVRVLRGGSWVYYARYTRSADRDNVVPDHRDYGLGFRVLRP